MEFLARFLEFVMIWLTRPSILPLVGAVAAILAALTVEPKTWRESLSRSVKRVVQVAVVFLLVAWILSLLASLCPERGSGQGGKDGPRTGTSGSAAPATPPVTPAPATLPASAPAHVDLLISFVSSPGNPSVAQEFSCDLLVKDTKEGAKRIEIRAKDMLEFDRLLVQQLRGVNLSQGPKPPIVLIKRSPFPGENVLRRVGDKVRAVIPGGTVVFDEQSAP